VRSPAGSFCPTVTVLYCAHFSWSSHGWDIRLSRTETGPKTAPPWLRGPKNWKQQRSCLRARKKRTKSTRRWISQSHESVRNWFCLSVSVYIVQKWESRTAVQKEEIDQAKRKIEEKDRQLRKIQAELHRPTQFRGVLDLGTKAAMVEVKTSARWQEELDSANSELARKDREIRKVRVASRVLLLLLGQTHFLEFRDWEIFPVQCRPCC